MIPLVLNCDKIFSAPSKSKPHLTTFFKIISFHPQIPSQLYLSDISTVQSLPKWFSIRCRVYFHKLEFCQNRCSIGKVSIRMQVGKILTFCKVGTSKLDVFHVYSHSTKYFRNMACMQLFRLPMEVHKRFSSSVCDCETNTRFYRRRRRRFEIRVNFLVWKLFHLEVVCLPLAAKPQRVGIQNGYSVEALFFFPLVNFNMDTFLLLAICIGWQFFD